MKLVLASSSPYRRQLLERLNIDFITASPNTDESRNPGESPQQLVRRLSIEKSQALKESFPNALIIGSDQVIITKQGGILGKPGDHETATRHLKQVRGSEVSLITGVALYNTQTRHQQFDSVKYEIAYRDYSDEEIEHYLLYEKPYNCAGALKSEGLGICLLRYLRGDDPTAIIGLPLIRLTDMLKVEGISTCQETVPTKISDSLN